MRMDEEEERQFVIRPLQLNDLPFLVALEQASFPPNEAATPEKVPEIQSVPLTCRSSTVFAHVQNVH